MVEIDGETTSGDIAVRGDLVTKSFFDGSVIQLAAEMSFGQSSHGLSLGGTERR